MDINNQNTDDPIYKVDPQPTSDGKSGEAGSGSPGKNWFSAHLVLGIVFLVAVAAAIIAGIYYWQTVRQIPPPTTTPVHKPQVDATANWKTYMNTQYGFEFKYPSDFDFVTVPGLNKTVPQGCFMQGDSACADNSGIGFAVNVISQTSDQCKQFWDSVGGPAATLSDSKTINSNLFYFGFISADNASVYHMYRQGSCYELVIMNGGNLSDNAQMDAVFNQILSTFKFIQ